MRREATEATGAVKQLGCGPKASDLPHERVMTPGKMAVKKGNAEITSLLDAK